MNDLKIPLSYTPIPREALLAVLDSYSKKNHNELVIDFERKICSLTGSKFAIALNSGTAAIHLGLKALDVQADDVVMVSTFTYVASVNPIRYLGAVPFFIDSSDDDWNMDPELLGSAIERCIALSKKPKAILVVHTYGMPAKMNRIKSIADKFQIPILEDAAEGIGSLYEEKHVGTLGEVGILSFNNNKLFTTYGGGALITNNQAMAAKVNSWAGQSRDNLPFYEHREIGFNYKMSLLNAAAGLSQVDSLPQKIAERRNTFQRYYRAMSNKVEWQNEAPNLLSNRWITAVELPSEFKVGDVQKLLAKQGIETRPVWKPMHLQPVFREFQSAINGCAEKLFERGICLPSGEGLKDSQVIEISNLVLNCI